MKIKIFIFIFISFLLTLPIRAEKTHIEIAETNADTIVTVNALRTNGSSASATGFIISPDGFIATAAHIITGAKILNITFRNGAISEEAQIIDVTKNKNLDLAILKVPVNNLPVVTFANSNLVQVGEDITVIGNPRRLQNTVTDGLISQVRAINNKINWFQISAPISPSSSGSPVFNTDGYVIAIATSSLKGEENQNLNFAIPSNYLLAMMKEHSIMPSINTKPVYASGIRGYFQRFRDHIKKCWAILKNKLSGK